MNFSLICLVFALVLFLIEAFMRWAGQPARPLPHFGWLGLAFFIAAEMLRAHA